MNSEDKTWWEEFRASKKNTLTNNEFKVICLLHSRYFNHRYQEPCTCSPKRIQQWINDLNKLYNE